MTWLDYALVAVCGFSIAWGIWRGLVREVLSILGWVIAFLAASLFAGPLAQSLPQSIPGQELRLIAAYAGVFAGSLLLASLAGLIISRLAKAAGLGALDRALGAVFGAARAVLLVLVFALLAGLTVLPRHSAWKESFSGIWLAKAALALKPWLPQSLAGQLSYE